MTLTADVDVELRGLGLRYDDTEPGQPDALARIDLRVPAGTILGLLGRNGSGKTSLMSLLASLRRPTAGEVLVGGADPWEDADRMAAVALIGPGGDGGEWKVQDALEFSAAAAPGVGRGVRRAASSTCSRSRT